MPLFSSPQDGVWVRSMRERDFAAVLDWFSTYFFGCGVAILLAVDLTALSSSEPSPAFSAVMRSAAGGLMVAAVAVVAGWLLGLLFGIPRSLSRPQPSASQQTGAVGLATVGDTQVRPSRTNTNLEDVSDWLTKTIVGLGLANLYLIPGYVWRKSGQVGAQIFPNNIGGQSFVLLIALYFATGGFWIGYVGTRTIITLLFDLIDRGGLGKAVAEAADPRNLEVDEATRFIKPPSAGVQEADAKLLPLPLQAMNTSLEMAAWGAAKARNGELGAALTAISEAAKAAPNDPSIKRLFSILKTANPNP